MMAEPAYKNPQSLPWRPYGRVDRLSVSTDRTTLFLNRSFLITPSPPQYFPAPPEPGRREKCSKMTGYLNNSNIKINKY